MKHWAGSRCFVGLAVICHHVLAQEQRDAPTAEALFRSGREAIERGDAETACKRFHESYRLDPAPGTLLNIARCEEALHHLADAWEKYQRLAETLPSGDERLSLVRQRLFEVEARLPRLTLKVHPGSSSVEVMRDGVMLNHAVLGVSLPMNPGEHRIVVVAEQKLPREYVVFLAESEQLSLSVEPGEPMAKGPAMSPSAPHTATTARSAPTPVRKKIEIGLFGGGIVALVAAAATGTWYVVSTATAHDHCQTPGTCDDEGLAAAGRADALQVTAIALGAVGVGALAGGIVLSVTDRSASPAHAGQRARLVVGAGFVGLRSPF